MKILLLALLLSGTATCFANVPTIGEIRELYQKAAVEEKSCLKMLALLKLFDEKNNPVLAGYKACATMIMAKHVMNPISKLSYFNKGKNLLEKCVGTANESVELRFLRFSIQTNLPSFLGYKSSISADKKMLLQALPQLQDGQLKQLVFSFLQQSDALTPAEKKGIKTVM